MVEPLDHETPLQGDTGGGSWWNNQIDGFGDRQGRGRSRARHSRCACAWGLEPRVRWAQSAAPLVSTYEPAHGVSVEVGTTQVAIDIVLTASFGVPLHELASKVRDAVFAAVQELTGLQVIEVNIEIGDVHIPVPDERTAKQNEPRRGEPE